MSKVYIQRRDKRGLETVDEFPTNTRSEKQEARRCLAEYRLSDPAGEYYISRRACKAWREDEEET